MIKQITAAAAANKGKIYVVYLDTFNSHKKTEGLSTRSLSTLEDCDFIQQLFSICDIWNNGTRLGEVISLIKKCVRWTRPHKTTPIILANQSN